MPFSELGDTDSYSKDMFIPAENGKPLPRINTFDSSSDIRNIKDFMNDIALNKSYQLELPSAIMLQDEFDTALLFLTI